MYAQRFISGGQAQRVAKALRNRSAFRHVMHKRSTTITWACRGLNWTSPTSLMLGDSNLRAYLVGIDFLGSKQFRSAQCCISFVRESKSAGGPSLMSNFGRAAAVEISQICCGLAPTAPPFLRAICSIPSFGI